MDVRAAFERMEKIRELAGDRELNDDEVLEIDELTEWIFDSQDNKKE